MTQLLNNNHDLWQRIKTFRFDEPDTQFTFCQKLAGEQGWSPSFSERAIEEYRKFIYLCCVLPGGASPPQIVDEVWHLHLTYTISYWEDLCKNVICRPLHHHPSKGGAEEASRHISWYAKTLEGYAATFGEAPPPDIWPVDRQAKILPAVNSTYSPFLLLLLPLMVPPLLFNKAHPFALHGSQFLIFFPLLMLAAIGCAWLFTRKRTGYFVAKFPAALSALSDLDLLALAEGRHRAIQYCLTFLVHEGRISIGPDNQFRILSTAPVDDVDANRLLQRLITSYGNEPFDYEAADMRVELRGAPAITAAEEAEHSKWWQLIKAPFATAFIIGIVRVAQGISNGRPVTYLVLELVIAFILCLGFLQRFRKPQYDKLYAAQTLNEKYISDEPSFFKSFINHDTAVLSAVAGFALLYPLFIIHTPIIHPEPSFWSSGGDGSGGCGSSGCGSSCGGGCGGCGS